MNNKHKRKMVTGSNVQMTHSSYPCESPHMKTRNTHDPVVSSAVAVHTTQIEKVMKILGN